MAVAQGVFQQVAQQPLQQLAVPGDLRRAQVSGDGLPGEGGALVRSLGLAVEHLHDALGRGGAAVDGDNQVGHVDDGHEHLRHVVHEGNDLALREIARVNTRAAHVHKLQNRNLPFWHIQARNQIRKGYLP